METKHDHRNILVEKKLGLPTKQQEIMMFVEAYDPVAIFDCYLPLADYLMDEYVCPNDNVRIIIEESVYSGLMMAIIKFRRSKQYETETTFVFYFSLFVRDLMDDLVREGKIYALAKMQVAA